MPDETRPHSPLPARGEEVTLSNEEILRYGRHLIMPEVGMEGQRRLKSARVLLIGTGGLGAPLGMYLAAAGVGTLGLVDFDVVDYSNLQRQIIHGTSDVGRPKLHSAHDRIKEINPYTNVELHDGMFMADKALDIVREYDIVIDGTDNFPTRYLVNDACVLLNKPNVYGSIFRFEGQASLFWAEKGPCYRCLYPEPPPPGMVPSCAEGGVLGVLPGIIGCLQANEALKLIMGIGDPLIGRLLLFDALKMKFRELKLRKDKDCPLCGDNPTIHELQDYEALCGIGMGQESAGTVAEEGDIEPKDLAGRLNNGNRPFLLDVRNPEEWAITRLEGATLIPLPELASRYVELPGNEEIVVYCRSGQRSAKAVEFLRSKGFRQVRNLPGGTLRWSDEIDPKMPKY
ncbi:MAG: UBA/THIF-type binding fold [Armatimonadetes bacterium]|jgi:adenylyltransferase/sulfurtransferase|nr:UBA/THIF-type binding fold [Armatimonadota bacterium]